MNAFVISLNVFLIVLIISQASTIATIIGVVLLLLQVISYFLCFSLNPGIPDMNRIRGFDINGKDLYNALQNI